MASTDPHFRLRLPEDLHAKVVEEARRHERSINAEVVFRLRNSFAQEPTKADEVRELIRNIRAEIGYYDHKIQEEQTNRARLQQMLAETLETQKLLDEKLADKRSSSSLE